MAKAEPPSNPESSFDPTQLITEHQAGIWRYLRALGCEAALAEDLTQDTFLAVLQKPFEEINDAATAGYLRTVARNLFISHQRRSGKVRVMEDIETVDNWWTEWVRDSHDHGDDLLAALRDCMNQLTDRAKLALNMRFRDRSTREAIANALEITEHGAKNLMQRAKKQLKVCVESKVK